MTCPNCKVTIDAAQYGITDDELNSKVHCTLDCHGCRSLLLIENGVLKDFHKTIHEDCPDWPEDGVGTGSLTIGDLEDHEWHD